MPTFSFLVIEEQLRQYGIDSAETLEFDLEVYGEELITDELFKMRIKLNLKEAAPSESPVQMRSPEPVKSVKIEGYPYVGWALKSANVRKGVSAKSNLVGELRKGEEIIVIGDAIDSGNTLWYEIEYNAGTRGYVRSDLLDVRTQVDTSALYQQIEQPVKDTSPISLSFEEIRSAFMQNMGSAPAWKSGEIRQTGEKHWMFDLLFTSDPKKYHSEVHYRITQNDQIALGIRANATVAQDNMELLKTAKRIHDGGEYGGYLSNGDFDYSDFGYLAGNLLKVFTSDLNYGLVGDGIYNFFERAIAIGYEDDFVYGFDSDHFADGYGDQFTCVGDYEICFAIRDMQLEMSIRKRGVGPGAGQVISGTGTMVPVVQTTAYEEQPVSEYPKTGTITGSNVNIRQEPDTGSKRIAKYQRGTIVTVLGEEKRGEYTWYRIVVSGGQDGYVREDLIELNRNIAAKNVGKTDSAESKGVDSIVFRDIPWYSSKAEVEEKLFESGGWIGGWMSNANNIYRLDAIDYESITLGSERVDGGGYRAFYSGLSVAGYMPSDTNICYIYPIENNQIIKDNSRAEMYFGWYSFKHGDFSDHKSIFDDLKEKLISIYGKGKQSATKYHTKILWMDKKGNLIQLLINDDCDYVSLGYMAADADARLNRMEKALKTETAATEAKTREQNAGNTSGL